MDEGTFSTLSTGLTMGTKRQGAAVLAGDFSFSTLSTGLTMGTGADLTLNPLAIVFQYPIHGSDHGNPTAGARCRARTALSVPYPRV